MATRPITKINQLVVAESFIQTHFVKGYKYIDKAGEIVNYFHDEKKNPPVFSMDLSGLDIKNPTPAVQEIKISANSFWAHAISPDSLEVLDSFFTPKTQDIIQILEVEEISRIGWRNYFVFECADEQERDEITQKFVPIPDFKFGQNVYMTECNGFSLNIRIGKLNKNVEPSTPSLLIDIDTYKKYEPYSNASNLNVEFLKLKGVIRSAEFLALMNEILE